MCGIAGAITYKAINESNIENAKKSLRRRGPDYNFHTVKRNEWTFYYFDSYKIINFRFR